MRASRVHHPSAARPPWGCMRRVASRGASHRARRSHPPAETKARRRPPPTCAQAPTHKARKLRGTHPNLISKVHAGITSEFSIFTGGNLKNSLDHVTILAKFNHELCVRSIIEHEAPGVLLRYFSCSFFPRSALLSLKYCAKQFFYFS